MGVEIEIIVFLAIIIFAGIKFATRRKEEYKEHWIEEQRSSEREQHQRMEQNKQIKQQIYTANGQLDEELKQFMFGTEGSYNEFRAHMQKKILDAQNLNRKLPIADNRGHLINAMKEKVEKYDAFVSTIKALPMSLMMDANNYGNINKEYWDKIRSLNKDSVEEYIEMCSTILNDYNYEKVYTLDANRVMECMWFLATDKPYSAEAFHNAMRVYRCVMKSSQIDAEIAEMYAMRQVGGEDVLRDRVRMILDKCTYIPEQLTIIASSLMWMNAYRSENTILEYMLSKGMPMSEKAQERLHALANGGGKAPSSYDVNENKDENTLYFDVSSLAWREDEYLGMFDNLAFQEKKLAYALAIRDDDKNLVIPQGVSFENAEEICRKLNLLFTEEYGEMAGVKTKMGVALSGSGEERIEGYLAMTDECSQLGVFTHVARIGKKMNIKFYTLYMPSEEEISLQKQKVLSMYKKMSPSVSMWESSLKDTFLLGIQQMLNQTTQTTESMNTITENNGAIF